MMYRSKGEKGRRLQCRPWHGFSSSQPLPLRWRKTSWMVEVKIGHRGSRKKAVNPIVSGVASRGIQRSDGLTLPVFEVQPSKHPEKSHQASVNSASNA